MNCIECVLTADEGQHVGDGQIEEVAVGRRLHVRVAGDDRAGARVAHQSGGEGEGVHRSEGHQPGQGQPLWPQDGSQVVVDVGDVQPVGEVRHGQQAFDSAGLSVSSSIVTAARNRFHAAGAKQVKAIQYYKGG
ncbi:hypothetical protein AVEN_114859-1 [Araneus ventricosus]|uniref:Uncharacterized protein n=1 Tax=Araneus ventricosus TaxID=182803 RepID=A0A4Y2QZM7_ARAVE|nr:hypothetical protein AVEN_114859-1 [Araneus ventricosus]